jgi:2Fe-2S ferredoxin
MRFDMPKVRFLPDSNLCPKGAVIDAKPGDNVCELALKNNIEI